MPHSTTGTTSYVIFKYSRSYPRKRIPQKTQIASQNGPETTSDWQHFTNPTIRVVLDVTTGNGETESVRLRIIWKMDSGITSGNDQQDVVFEDMDLLSFSNMLSNFPKKHPLESLPLKAVYRDAVVGIRYLHSRETSDVPTYRRFQISFLSASEASEFISSIKSVCPCKLNPTPIPAPNMNGQPQSTSHLSRPPVSVPTTRPSVSLSFLPNRIAPFAYTSALLPQSTPTQSRKQTTHISTPQTCASYTLSSSPLMQQAIPSDHSTLFSDTGMIGQRKPHPPNNQAQSDTICKFSQQHEHSAPAEPIVFEKSGQSPARAPIVAPLVSTNMPDSSLPNSSFSASSGPSTQRRGALDTIANERTIVREGNHPILKSLVEATSIYDLPASALERAVGEIIHEDGFVRMLEKLSDMLTIRRVIDA